MNKGRIKYWILALVVGLSLMQAGAAAAVDDGVQSEASESGSASVTEDNAQNLKKWKDMSEEDRQELRQRFQKFKNMDASNKKDILEKYHRYRKLSPEKKERLKSNWEKFKKEPAAERQRLREKYKRWENLSDADKKRFKERMHRFGVMSPEEKEKFLHKRAEWQKLPTEKRQELRERYIEKKRSIQGGGERKGDRSQGQERRRMFERKRLDGSQDRPSQRPARSRKNI